MLCDPKGYAPINHRYTESQIGEVSTPHGGLRFPLLGMDMGRSPTESRSTNRAFGG